LVTVVQAARKQEEAQMIMLRMSRIQAGGFMTVAGNGCFVEGFPGGLLPSHRYQSGNPAAVCAKIFRKIGRSRNLVPRFRMILGKPMNTGHDWMSRDAGARGVIQLMFAISLSSCGTTPHQPQAPTGLAPYQSVTASGHWVKVRSNPPTWYPRGTRSDCPIDFRSGEWVKTDNHDGTRLFIPFHVTGEIPRKTLLKEALAARGPDVHQPPTGENCASFAKVVGNIVVGPPLFLMTLYGAKYALHEKFTVDRKTFFPFDP
jgi:hypothetical protein